MCDNGSGEECLKKKPIQNLDIDATRFPSVIRKYKAAEAIYLSNKVREAIRYERQYCKQVFKGVVRPSAARWA